MKKNKMLTIRKLALRKKTVANLGSAEMIRVLAGLDQQVETNIIGDSGSSVDSTNTSQTAEDGETKGCNLSTGHLVIPASLGN